MNMLATILGAVLVIGTASIALADDGTDQALDTSRFGTAISAPHFQSSNVSLPMNHTIYLDVAGASHDNGGN
jgi:hypothetical protein